MPPRCILAAYAHPDDETSSGAALMKMYAARGVDVHVITATRGELGTLGTGGVTIERADLPAVREAEERAVLHHLGVSNPPTYFNYRDGELAQANREEAAAKVLAVMERIQPDVVLTFGPTGLSQHADHIAMHHIATTAFHRYLERTESDSRLLYWAIPKEVSEEFELGITGPEVEPNVILDVSDFWQAKVEALRLYRSQEDAQELAQVFEERRFNTETFHQVHPPLPEGVVLTSL